MYYRGLLSAGHTSGHCIGNAILNGVCVCVSVHMKMVVSELQRLKLAQYERMDGLFQVGMKIHFSRKMTPLILGAE